jgi:hypothetical protein
MSSSGKLHRVAPIRRDVSEGRFASIIRVTRIDEVGKTLTVPSNRNTQRDRSDKFLRNVVSHKSHTALTSQKTTFFIATAMKTSNLIKGKVVQLIDHYVMKAYWGSSFDLGSSWE